MKRALPLRNDSPSGYVLSKIPSWISARFRSIPKVISRPAANATFDNRSSKSNTGASAESPSPNLEVLESVEGSVENVTVV
eukprot:scaffold136260_cov73-Cyclotella_meneghiniana.AAC.1